MRQGPRRPCAASREADPAGAEASRRLQVLPPRPRAVARYLGLASALALAGTAADAGHALRPADGGEPRIEFASDEPISAEHHLTESLSWGLAIEIESETAVNFDLDDAEEDDESDLVPRLALGLAFEPSAHFGAYAEVELSQQFFLAGRDGRDTDPELELLQAMVVLSDVVDGVTLSFGRQQWTDEREWLLEDEVDSAVVAFRAGEWALEFAYGRPGHVRRDLLKDEDGREADYFLARGFHALGEDAEASVFALYHDGPASDGDEDLLFLGAQAAGELGGAGFWANASGVFGEAEGRDVRGFGIDLGVVKTFEDHPMRPYIGAGIAFGTGDDGSGTDTAFRQSGLHDNSAPYGGLAGFKYYGEVLDPELSNLAVLTLDVGFHPTAESSVDIVYHHYVQHRASDEFRDAALDAEPAGRRRNIGDEIDVIVGIGDLLSLEVELVGGVFLPGPAFEDRDPAYFGTVTLQYEF